MATLNEAMRAEDRREAMPLSFSNVCRQIASGVLRAVGPFYGYGIDSLDVATPSDVMEERELCAGFRRCISDVDRLEDRRNAVVISAETGDTLRVLFSHLPGVVAHEGWTTETIRSASWAYKAIASASYKESATPLNLLYHSVVSSALQLETIPIPIPIAIAPSLLRILARWEDLAGVTISRNSDALTSPYFSSTLTMGRELARRLNQLCGEDSVAGDRLKPVDERGLRSLDQAQGLLQQAPVLKALLS